jgi:predicted Ser/Thr protein kinase
MNRKTLYFKGLIGQGSFGSVYAYGNLQDDVSDIAVKIQKPNSQQASLMTETHYLRKLQKFQLKHVPIYYDDGYHNGLHLMKAEIV